MFKSESTHIQGSPVILRLYNLETDPEKIVKYLYTKYNSPEGIQKIKNEDKVCFKESKVNFRLVAEIDGEIHASLVLMKNLTSNTMEYTMYSFVTSKSKQGSGISLMLFNNAKKLLQQLNITVLQVSTDKDNVRAQKFYEKAGFKKNKEDRNQISYILKF